MSWMSSMLRFSSFLLSAIWQAASSFIPLFKPTFSPYINPSTRPTILRRSTPYPPSTYLPRTYSTYLHQPPTSHTVLVHSLHMPKPSLYSLISYSLTPFLYKLSGCFFNFSIVLGYFIFGYLNFIVLFFYLWYSKYIMFIIIVILISGAVDG